MTVLFWLVLYQLTSTSPPAVPAPAAQRTSTPWEQHLFNDTPGAEV